MGFFQRLKLDVHLVLKDGRISEQEVGKRHFSSRKESADAQRQVRAGAPGAGGWHGLAARSRAWGGSCQAGGAACQFPGAVVIDKHKQDSFK